MKRVTINLTPALREELKAKLLANRRIVAGPLSTPCWEWTRYRDGSTYGGIWLRPIRGKRKRFILRVHRLSLALFANFELSSERLVCHHCDNPPCFNPDHLFIGTDLDNTIDKVQKKRHFHKLDEHARQVITAALASGELSKDIAQSLDLSPKTVRKATDQTHYVSGERSNLHKLKAFEVIAIRELAATGSRRKDIAARFNVSLTCVDSIVNRRSWKHLT